MGLGAIEGVVVPTVDLSGWSSADPTAREVLVAQVDEVCSAVGFLQVVGHGVPPELITEMLAVTTEFFERPVSEKMSYRPPNASVNRGYAPVGSESLAYSLGTAQAPPDLFEAFNVGVERRPTAALAADDPNCHNSNCDPNCDNSNWDDPYYKAEAHRMFAPNIWPTEPARMREVWCAYFDAMTDLAARLMSLFATALSLPADFFASRTGRAPNVMRANHYLRQPGSPEALSGQLRMGAHTDYGACTILLADDVDGLEILGTDGDWHGVRPAPGAFLVNLGDLLAEWTNDRWRSTLHRVVPPPASVDGAARRRSVAFFHEANYDHLVECLPSCTGPDNPPKYAPVTAGEHLMAKLLGPRTLSASTATSTTGDRYRG